MFSEKSSNTRTLMPLVFRNLVAAKILTFFSIFRWRFCVFNTPDLLRLHEMYSFFVPAEVFLFNPLDSIWTTFLLFWFQIALFFRFFATSSVKGFEFNELTSRDRNDASFIQLLSKIIRSFWKWICFVELQFQQVKWNYRVFAGFTQLKIFSIYILTIQ